MSEQSPQEQAEHNTEQPTPEFSSGQILANARQSLGISLEDLSEQIRVPLKVLQQIEADDLPTNLPETFVRGYIRSYAKKVGVDEHAVLKEVETMGASKVDAMEMHSFSKRSKRKRTERRLTIISWGIVAILAIALVAWWVQTKGSEMFGSTGSANNELPVVTATAEPTGTEENTEELQSPKAQLDATGEQVIAETTNADVTNSTVSQAADKLTPPQTQPARESQLNAQTVEQLNSESPTTQSAVPTQNVPTQNVATNGSESTQMTEVDTDGDTPKQQAPIVLSDAEKRLLADNGEVDESDFIKVEFEFENDCWVEVYDAFDERIAIGNKNAGYVMTLNAQGPFRVLLGNPDGVRIWVNGNPFDMSDLPKNRVARFEVDANL